MHAADQSQPDDGAVHPVRSDRKRDWDAFAMTLRAHDRLAAFTGGAPATGEQKARVDELLGLERREYYKESSGLPDDQRARLWHLRAQLAKPGPPASDLRALYDVLPGYWGWLLVGSGYARRGKRSPRLPAEVLAALRHEGATAELCDAVVTHWSRAAQVTLDDAARHQALDQLSGEVNAVAAHCRPTGTTRRLSWHPYPAAIGAASAIAIMSAMPRALVAQIFDEARAQLRMLDNAEASILGADVGAGLEEWRRAAADLAQATAEPAPVPSGPPLEIDKRDVALLERTRRIVATDALVDFRLGRRPMPQRARIQLSLDVAARNQRRVDESGAPALITRPLGETDEPRTGSSRRGGSVENDETVETAMQVMAAEQRARVRAVLSRLLTAVGQAEFDRVDTADELWLDNLVTTRQSDERLRFLVAATDAACAALEAAIRSVYATGAEGAYMVTAKFGELIDQAMQDRPYWKTDGGPDARRADAQRQARRRMRHLPAHLAYTLAIRMAGAFEIDRIGSETFPEHAGLRAIQSGVIESLDELHRIAAEHAINSLLDFAQLNFFRGNTDATLDRHAQHGQRVARAPQEASIKRVIGCCALVSQVSIDSGELIDRAAVGERIERQRTRFADVAETVPSLAPALDALDAALAALADRGGRR